EYKAVARIQSIMDIKSMKFINLILGAFTENDQSASGSILSHVKKGDLVIRDLGYFSTLLFTKLIAAEVYFLSRLQYGTSLYDKQGNPLSLKKILRGGKLKDAWVLVGAKHTFSVRLVMIPLSEKQASERRRRARLDRDKRMNHSKTYYKWLGYSAHITTVDKAVWTAKDVVKAYRVRWQIEIIFKSWKTCFHLQEMIQEGGQNEHRVKVSIYLMLLFICLFMKEFMQDISMR
ncbi:IS4 family transposase, partial [Fulvivirgaceae bacterium PWU5]